MKSRSDAKNATDIDILYTPVNWNIVLGCPIVDTVWVVNLQTQPKFSTYGGWLNRQLIIESNDISIPQKLLRTRKSFGCDKKYRLKLRPV